MKSIRIIIPFSRPENLARMLESCQVEKYGAGRVFVCNETEHRKLDRDIIGPRDIVLLGNFGSGSLRFCMEKCNAALDALTFPNEYFIFSSDDNIIPARVLEAWQSAPGKAVIVCSHKRGQRIPTNGLAHGTSDLVACPENMRISFISGEQVLVRRDAYGCMRFDLGVCADGAMIERLWRILPRDEFHFMPSVFMPFNALQPGRWDDAELQKIL